MQDNVRTITPVSISGLIPAVPSTGMPIFEIIRPEQLFVDPAYQRDIGERELTCKAANVRLLRAPNSQISDGSRQTIAVKQIEGLIARRGRIMARQVLEIIADAERGLITATHIKAVEFLLTDSEFAGHVSGEDITSAIIDLLYTAEEDAKRFAETHRMPHWKALANVWYRKCKKRRGTLRAA